MYRVVSTHLESASPCFRDILREEREGPCECKLSEPGLTVVRLPDIDPKAFSLVYNIVSESATSEFWASLQFKDIYRVARFTNEFAMQFRLLKLLDRLLEMKPRSLQDAAFAMLAAYQVDLTVPFCRASKMLIHSDDGLNPSHFRFLRNPVMEKMFLCESFPYLPSLKWCDRLTSPRCARPGTHAKHHAREGVGFVFGVLRLD